MNVKLTAVFALISLFFSSQFFSQELSREELKLIMIQPGDVIFRSSDHFVKIMSGKKDSPDQPPKNLWDYMTYNDSDKINVIFKTLYYDKIGDINVAKYTIKKIDCANKAFDFSELVIYNLSKKTKSYIKPVEKYSPSSEGFIDKGLISLFDNKCGKN